VFHGEVCRGGHPNDDGGLQWPGNLRPIDSGSSKAVRRRKTESYRVLKELDLAALPKEVDALHQLIRQLRGPGKHQGSLMRSVGTRPPRLYSTSVSFSRWRSLAT